MNFISLTFVFSFPVVVLLYWKIPWKHRELFLLAVSYFFYIKESSWAGGLLLLTTAITYLAGIAVGYWKDTQDIKANWKLARTFEPDMDEKCRKTYISGWHEAVKRSYGWAN